jgi:polyketide cyclase/dehydrase/lipid transport protein
MAVIENSVEIGRSPDEVFDYTVDMRNELKWNPDVQSMEKTADRRMTRRMASGSADLLLRGCQWRPRHRAVGTGR